MMTPELRVLRALDEFRDALAGLMTARHEPAEAPALLTISHAARRLGISRSTATRWADDGRLRTIGGRKSRHVPRAEIERLAGNEKAFPVTETPGA